MLTHPPNVGLKLLRNLSVQMASPNSSSPWQKMHCLKNEEREKRKGERKKIEKKTLQDSWQHCNSYTGSGTHKG